MAFRATSISLSLVIEAEPRTSPASTTRLVVTSVSTPQRACGSAARKVSTIASEMRSQILSGWPSDTDSLVNTKSRLSKSSPFLQGSRYQGVQGWTQSLRPQDSDPAAPRQIEISRPLGSAGQRSG